MQQDRTLAPDKSPLSIVISSLMWLLSAVLALALIFALRELLLWALANLLIDPTANSNFDAVNTIQLANDCGALIFGILCLGIIIVSSEYFFKHVGQRRLIHRLAGLIVVEAAIVLPVALIFWRQ